MHTAHKTAKIQSFSIYTTTFLHNCKDIFNIHLHMGNDFHDFCRRMRIKWHFRNSQQQRYQEIPKFCPISSWKPPIGHPNLEVFLNKIKEDLFKAIKNPLRYSNLSM